MHLTPGYNWITSSFVDIFERLFLAGYSLSRPAVLGRLQPLTIWCWCR